MNILHLTTNDIQGGAARAAYRLHQGLCQLDQQSLMLVRHKSSTAETVIEVTTPPTEADPAAFFLERVIQDHYLAHRRTDLSNTLFTLPYPGYDITTLAPAQRADVINLHWLAGFQSPATLHKLFALGKPVVWTLHDQAAFTGGCHYSAGCSGYRQNCAACPQLAGDTFNLPAVILQDKMELFRDANLTLVTPSRWLAECAKESRLFRGRRVEVIPHGLETDVFAPLPKTAAKASLNLPLRATVLLFGAMDNTQKSKGGEVLAEALRLCLNRPHFRQLITARRLIIMSFGLASSLMADLPLTYLGRLNSDEQLRLAYSAADLFILPSLEDNLPNTMLEALSCGTPVLGSAAGGIPDVIKDNFTGQLVPPGNSIQLAEAILALISAPKQLTIMGQQGRRLVETGYSLTTPARRYLALYQELQPGSTQPALAVEPGAATLEVSLGPQFQNIYPTLLLTALKEFALTADEERQLIEADRAARLEVIQQQQTQLQANEQTIHRLSEDLPAKERTIHRLSEDLLAKERVIHQLILFRDTSLLYWLSRPIHWLRRLKPWYNQYCTVRLGNLAQYPPRPLHVPAWYTTQPAATLTPLISIVTPSFNQAHFLERTIQSVLNQNYPALEYIIQDGGSTDNTPALLDHYRGRLAYCASQKDNGQSHALNLGFAHASGEIMAYLNSDDLLLPGALNTVAAYFAQHPEVDVVYGHRVVIDENDDEIGRWVLPPHDDKILRWADYIPQETLFWRRSIWQKSGNCIDENYKFAMDWELLLRFQTAGAKMVRLPRFLGAFRVHHQQKTSAQLNDVGTDEMARLRQQCHGRPVSWTEIGRGIGPYLAKSVVYHNLYQWGLLKY